MGEAAGVINFCERIKQTQLTIEARYGKRPTTPPPIPLPPQIVHNMDLLIPGPASTVYEIKYIDEMEDLDIGGPLSTFVGDVKPMSPRKRKAETPIEEEEEEEQEPEEVVKPRPMRNAKKAVTTPKKDPDWNISSDQSREDTELLPAVEVNTLMRDFGVLTCKLCPEEIQFQDFKSTKTHNDQEHSLKGVSCCDKTYSSRVRLYEHVKFHLAPEDIECDVCHKKFKSKANLKTHKEDQHAEQVIQCSSCEFTCKSENTLKRHELKHIPTDQRPVSCSECEFKCNYASQLTIHIKSRHSAVKEAFLCGICEKTFSTKGNLTNHHKSFHDTESHRSTCGQCGKAVRRLSRHLNICQKKLDLKCPHCPNVHPNEHALKTHITRIHMTDKSKLTCPECGKVLSRESHLKVGEKWITSFMEDILINAPFLVLRSTWRNTRRRPLTTVSSARRSSTAAPTCTSTCGTNIMRSGRSKRNWPTRNIRLVLNPDYFLH